jgi:HPt (histidine-containing phosphotransfer) domain-containing protein
MHQAARYNDDTTLFRVAHNLKSNSATLGACTLSAHCKEIEESMKVGNLQRVAELVMQTTTAFEQVRTILQRKLEQE